MACLPMTTGTRDRPTTLDPMASIQNPYTLNPKPYIQPHNTGRWSVSARAIIVNMNQHMPLRRLTMTCSQWEIPDRPSHSILSHIFAHRLTTQSSQTDPSPYLWDTQAYMRNQDPHLTQGVGTPAGAPQPAGWS